MLAAVTSAHSKIKKSIEGGAAALRTDGKSALIPPLKAVMGDNDTPEEIGNRLGGSIFFMRDGTIACSKVTGVARSTDVGPVICLWGAGPGNLYKDKSFLDANVTDIIIGPLTVGGRAGAQRRCLRSGEVKILIVWSFEPGSFCI